jgi:hypothetical protein
MDTRFGLSRVNNVMTAHGFAVMEYDFREPDNIFSAYDELSWSVSPSIYSCTSTEMLSLYV